MFKIVTGLVTGCFLVYTGLLATAYKRVRYHAGLSGVMLRHYIDPVKNPWWSQIDDGLYLSALPLSSMGHAGQLKFMGIHVVISITDNFELSISADEWVEWGIFNYQIESPDHEPVPLEKICEGVEVIRNNGVRGVKQLVHCKSGVGRSATLIIAYLLKYGLKNGYKFENVSEAYSYVEKCRHIHLNDKQKLSLYHYWETLKA